MASFLYLLGSWEALKVASGSQQMSSIQALHFLGTLLRGDSDTPQDPGSQTSVWDGLQLSALNFYTVLPSPESFVLVRSFEASGPGHKIPCGAAVDSHREPRMMKAQHSPLGIHTP